MAAAQADSKLHAFILDSLEVRPNHGRLLKAKGSKSEQVDFFENPAHQFSKLINRRPDSGGIDWQI